MTEEVKQKSMIEIIAEQMHKQARHNSFYGIKEAADVGTMPALAPDEDNAAKQNAEKIMLLVRRQFLKDQPK